MDTKYADDGFPFSQVYKDHVDAAISNYIAFAQKKKHWIGTAQKHDGKCSKHRMSPLKLQNPFIQISENNLTPPKSQPASKLEQDFVNKSPRLKQCKDWEVKRMYFQRDQSLMHRNQIEVQKPMKDTKEESSDSCINTESPKTTITEVQKIVKAGFAIEQQNETHGQSSFAFFEKPARRHDMQIINYNQGAQSDEILKTGAAQDEISKTTLVSPKLSTMEIPSPMEIPSHYVGSTVMPLQTTLRITHMVDSEVFNPIPEEKVLSLDKFLTMSSFMKLKEPIQPRPAFERVKANCHQKEVTLNQLDFKISKKETLDKILEPTVLQLVDHSKKFHMIAPVTKQIVLNKLIEKSTWQNTVDSQFNQKPLTSPAKIDPVTRIGESRAYNISRTNYCPIQGSSVGFQVRKEMTTNVFTRRRNTTSNETQTFTRQNFQIGAQKESRNDVESWRRSGSVQPETSLTDLSSHVPSRTQVRQNQTTFSGSASNGIDLNEIETQEWMQLAEEVVRMSSRGAQVRLPGSDKQVTLSPSQIAKIKQAVKEYQQFNMVVEQKIDDNASQTDETLQIESSRDTQAVNSGAIVSHLCALPRLNGFRVTKIKQPSNVLFPSKHQAPGREQSQEVISGVFAMPQQIPQQTIIAEKLNQVRAGIEKRKIFGQERVNMANKRELKQNHVERLSTVEIHYQEQDSKEALHSCNSVITQYNEEKLAKASIFSVRLESGRNSIERMKKKSRSKPFKKHCELGIC